MTADRQMCAIPVAPKGEKFHLDLIGPLVRGDEGELYVAGAVDSCTKWVEAFALRSKIASEVESFFFRDIIARYPVHTVVTDNGDRVRRRL